jgi:hypothetical protein
VYKNKCIYFTLFNIVGQLLGGGLCGAQIPKKVTGSIQNYLSKFALIYKIKHYRLILYILILQLLYINKICI